jgi:hypothetical protein
MCMYVEVAPVCGTVIKLKHWKSDFTLLESTNIRGDELCAMWPLYVQSVIMYIKGA